MTVADLIEFLKTQDQTLPVVYIRYSDYDKLEADLIDVQELCLSRPDGHVQGYRRDKLTNQILSISG